MFDVFDKMVEVLKEFNDNSPMPAKISIKRGDYTPKGRLRTPYVVTISPERNMNAVIKYRKGEEVEVDPGKMIFVPERINRIAVDFCKAGCEDFDLYF